MKSLCATLMALSCSVLAQTADPTPDYRREATAIHTLLTEMHGAVIGRLSDRKAPVRTFRFTLPGAVYRKDLHLVLFCEESTWLCGRAWIPAFNRMIHPVEARTVKVAGTADTPDFSFTLKCSILPDAALPAEQEPAGLALTIKGESGKDKAWGSFSGRLLDADIRGAVNGRIARYSRTAVRRRVPARPSRLAWRL